MFEDFEDEDIDVSPEAPDRGIVYAIWSRDGAAALTPEEGWAILHERYPEEPRFLLLQAFAELSDRTATASLGADYFLTKVEAIANRNVDALRAPLRELLAFAGGVLAKASGDDARRLVAIREAIAAEGEPPTKRDERAGLRLRRFERDVLRELHDRTQGGTPLGERSTTETASSPTNPLEQALADDARLRKPYRPTDRYERGELVEHPKFGWGVVTGLEPGRVAILFRDGPRKLVAG